MLPNLMCNCCPELPNNIIYNLSSYLCYVCIQELRQLKFEVASLQVPYKYETEGGYQVQYSIFLFKSLGMTYGKTLLKNVYLNKDPRGHPT
jgi:hypothetical protein